VVTTPKEVHGRHRDQQPNGPSRIVAGRVPELRRLVCLVVTLVLLNTY